MITIRAFQAISDNDSCRKYIEGHRRILEVYGVTKVTSSNIEWTKDPNVFVIIVESDKSDKVLGGARVQVAGPGCPLPIESAVSEKDYKIHDLVKEYSLKRTAELCGLWNSREVAGMGIGSVFLTRSGVSIVTQLNVSSIFALCAAYTVKMAENAGFVIEKSLGDNGTFYYPKEDLVATALVLKDTNTLVSADAQERKKIFELRNSPQQIVDEEGRRGKFEIKYNLLIPTIENVKSY